MLTKADFNSLNCVSGGDGMTERCVELFKNRKLL